MITTSAKNSVETHNSRIDIRINDFAIRSFRDIADQDYIAARMAFRANLIPQALWASQQALEKYLKCTLLLHRIPATRVSHDLNAALKLCKKLPFDVKLRSKSLEFFDYIADQGEYRYFDVSYFAFGLLLPQLDMTVWDLRRYCQILSSQYKDATAKERKVFALSLKAVQASDDRPPQEFKLGGGLLEKILDERKNLARRHLLWQNAFFGARARKTIRAHNYFQGANAPLFQYPDMLDVLVEYVYLPGKIEKGYREHLKAIQADPTKRP